MSDGTKIFTKNDKNGDKCASGGQESGLKLIFERGVAILVRPWRFPGQPKKFVFFSIKVGTINSGTSLDSREQFKKTGKLEILNIVSTFNKTYYQSGSQAKETFAISLDVFPVEAKNNKPLAWFPKFQCNAKKDIYQEVSSTGFVLKGIDTTNPQQREAIHLEVFKKALVKFIEHIYNKFPAGGKVVEIDTENNMAVIKASRATGLMANLEMVIYARKKGKLDAMRVPLYNATLETMGQEDSSELKIWRKNKSNSRAAKIITMIEKDWDAAIEEYDLWAASDGIAEPPDFINVAGDKK